MSILQEIQQLQMVNREAAGALLRAFVQDVFGLDATEVVLRPLAVSLNSFNGFLTLTDGRRLFFKSHVEPDSVIAEYYNSSLMDEAGYPIIRPVMASTEPGKQMLLYEVIEDQSAFDVAWAIERGHSGDLVRLASAQARGDDHLLACYERSLVWQTAEHHAEAPIHQLFHHRLTRGRLDSFYGVDTTIELPSIGRLPMSQVRQARWRINGVDFVEKLNDIIDRAKTLLNPAQAGPAVVGHGDAHNGNVFLRGDALVYFDPAFAGRHDPLLDLVKPLYHNVHAMWMYFPGELMQERGASLRVEDGVFVVTYPEALHPVREMFWRSKTERVLVPLLRLLKGREWLRPDWRLYLQTALACCPLLTMNLTDGVRFAPPIALLGLAHVMQMGGQSSDSSSWIERWFDSVGADIQA